MPEPSQHDLVGVLIDKNERKVSFDSPFSVEKDKLLDTKAHWKLKMEDVQKEREIWDRFLQTYDDEEPEDPETLFHVDARSAVKRHSFSAAVIKSYRETAEHGASSDTTAMTANGQKRRPASAIVRSVPEYDFPEYDVPELDDTLGLDVSRNLDQDDSKGLETSVGQAEETEVSPVPSVKEDKLTAYEEDYLMDDFEEESRAPSRKSSKTPSVVALNKSGSDSKSRRKSPRHSKQSLTPVPPEKDDKSLVYEEDYLMDVFDEESRAPSRRSSSKTRSVVVLDKSRSDGAGSDVSRGSRRKSSRYSPKTVTPAQSKIFDKFAAADEEDYSMDVIHDERRVPSRKNSTKTRSSIALNKSRSDFASNFSDRSIQKQPTYRKNSSRTTVPSDTTMTTTELSSSTITSSTLLTTSSLTESSTLSSESLSFLTKSTTFSRTPSTRQSFSSSLSGSEKKRTSKRSFVSSSDEEESVAAVNDDIISRVASYVTQRSRHLDPSTLDAEKVRSLIAESLSVETMIVSLGEVAEEEDEKMGSPRDSEEQLVSSDDEEEPVAADDDIISRVTSYVTQRSMYLDPSTLDAEKVRSLIAESLSIETMIVSLGEVAQEEVARMKSSKSSESKLSHSSEDEIEYVNDTSLRVADELVVEDLTTEELICETGDTESHSTHFTTLQSDRATIDSATSQGLASVTTPSTMQSKKSTRSGTSGSSAHSKAVRTSMKRLREKGVSRDRPKTARKKRVYAWDLEAKQQKKKGKKQLSLSERLNKMRRKAGDNGTSHDEATEDESEREDLVRRRTVQLRPPIKYRTEETGTFRHSHIVPSEKLVSSIEMRHSLDYKLHELSKQEEMKHKQSLRLGQVTLQVEHDDNQQVTKKRIHYADEMAEDQQPAEDGLDHREPLSQHSHTSHRVRISDPKVIPSESSDYDDSRGLSKLKAMSSRKLNFSNLQLRGFREIFSVIDHEDTGEFGAQELYDSILEYFPESEITMEIVEAIVEDINITETGKIHFDEFLFALSQPNNLVQLVPANIQTKLGDKLVTWEKLTGRRFKELLPRRGSNLEPSFQNIFFQLVKTIAAKHLNKDMQQYYIAAYTQIRDDTLLNWTSGKRVEGLSMYQIMDEYEELKAKAASMATIHNWDSPYAQPLLVDFRKTVEAQEEYDRKMKAFIIRANMAGLYWKRKKKRRKSKKSTEPTEQKPVSEEEIQFEDAEEAPAKKKGLKFVRKSVSAPVKESPKVELKKRCQSAKPVLVKPTVSRMRYSEFVPSTSVVPLPKFPLSPGAKVSYRKITEVKEVATDIMKRYYCRLSNVANREAKKYLKRMHPEQMHPKTRRTYEASYWVYCGTSAPHNSFYVPYRRREPHPDGVYVNGMRWK